MTVHDGVDDLIGILRSSLSFDRAFSSSTRVNIPSTSAPAPAWTATQQRRERCGWTPRAIASDDASDILTGANAIANVREALARLLPVRAAMQSASHARLWWLTIVKMTARLERRAGDEYQGAFDGVCDVLIDDIASLARAETAPERETWSARVGEALKMPVDVAARWETLAHATAGLFNHAPKTLIQKLSAGLKSRLAQAAREEVYWLLLVFSTVAPADGAADLVTRLMLELNPNNWSTPYRKSDFRQCISTTLEIILSRFLSTRKLGIGSIGIDTLNAVQSDVAKWMAENEKKQSNAGFPLRMILSAFILTQDDGQSMAKLCVAAEGRIVSGVENKMNMSSFFSGLRNLLLGLSPSMNASQLIKIIEAGFKNGMTFMEKDASAAGDGVIALAQAAVELHVVAVDRGVVILNDLFASRVPLLQAAGLIACEYIVRHSNAAESKAKEIYTKFIVEILSKPFELTQVKSFPSVAKAALLRSFRLMKLTHISDSFITQLACSATVDESITLSAAAEDSLLYVLEGQAELRDPSLQVLAAGVLNLRTLEPSTRLSAMNALASVCQLWVKRLDFEKVPDAKCNFERVEAASLLLVCDADSSVRVSAMKTLKAISMLHSKLNTGSKSVYSVLEKHLQLIDNVPELIVTFSSEVAQTCPAVCVTAHAQAYQRVQAMMVAEGDGKIPVAPVEPSEYKYHVWQNYMLFVCAANNPEVLNDGSRQVVAVGQRGSLSDLLKVVIPRLGRSEAEAEAVMRLFLILPNNSKAAVLKALIPLQGGLMASNLTKRKLREDLSTMLRFGYVYQNYGVSGVFTVDADSKTLDTVVDFVLMVCSYLKTTAEKECSAAEISQLRFLASNIVATVLVDAKKVQSLPGVTQGELWDSFYLWQDLMSVDATQQLQTASSTRERIRRLIQDKEKIPSTQDLCWAAREAMAALSVSEQFTHIAPKKVFNWLNKLSENAGDMNLELSMRLLTRLLIANPRDLFPSSLDFCHSSSLQISRIHLKAIASLQEEAMRYISGAQMMALVLYKILHNDAETRKAANVLLRAIQLQARVLVAKEDVKDELQLIAACEQLMKTGSQPIEEILLEVWKRQLDDAMSISKTRSPVLAVLMPWLSVLHLPHLVATGKAEQILNGLYQVTLVSTGDLRSQADQLWFAIGAEPRNVAPALRFLQEKAFEIATTNRDQSAFQTTKVACRMLSQSSFQQAIDQLVYSISFRALELDANNSKDAAVSKISLADVGIMLLSELATDHLEGFRFHLPVLAHAVAVTLVVTNEPMVRQYCGNLLCNLVSKSYNSRRAKTPASRLMMLFQNDGTQAWATGKIRQLVYLFPRAIDLDENLTSRWASEAQRWLLRSPSLSLSRASAMTLMALSYPLDDEAFGAILSATCASAVLLEENEAKKLAAGELTQSLLKIVTASLCEMSSQGVLMFTQAFWCGVSCLRTFDEDVYSCAINLCFVFLHKSLLSGPTMAVEVIKSCAPLPRGTQYPDLPIVESYEELLSITPEPMPSAEISFSQVVPLVIKGLLKPAICLRSIRVLAMLAPHVKGEVWSDTDVIVLIAYGVIPVILTSSSEVGSTYKPLINDAEARAIAHRLAQGLTQARILPRLSEALSKLAAERLRTKECLDQLDAVFTATVQQVQLPMAMTLLREFALSADVLTAKKILNILNTVQKAPKTFKREFLSMWSEESGAPRMSDAMYGVLLSARLDTDKSSVPACLDI